MQASPPGTAGVSTTEDEQRLQENLAMLHASASGVLALQPPGFSLRGNLEQLEIKMSDIINELGYHR